jgi:hypothetical protein
MHQTTPYNCWQWLIGLLLLVLNDAQSAGMRCYRYIIVARLLKQLEPPRQALNNLQLSLTAVKRPELPH